MSNLQIHQSVHGIGRQRKLKSRTKKVFSCNICEKKYSTQVSLQIHVGATHTGVRFPCTICPYEATREHSLKEHMTRHTGERPFTCEICSKTFSFQSNHGFHMKLHQRKASETITKEASCPLCNKILSSTKSLLSHTKLVHERSESHQCKTCGKILNSSKSLSEHILRHENSDRFVCGVCDKKFNQKVHLKTHTMLHSGTKPYKCPFCSNAYVEQSKMRNHIQNIHEEAKLDGFKCDNCQKQFKYKIKSPHEKVCKTLDFSGTEICCRLCGDKLTSLSMKDHWKVHPSEIQSQKCSFCAKVFIQPAHKRAHEKSVHQKIKEFECKICPQKFSKFPSVEIHMKTQHQDKTYKCQHCTTSFMLESTLTDHQKFHDMTRLHVCDVCGLRYKKKESLQAHSRVHAQDRVTCSKCNKELKTLVILARHDKEQHKKEITWVSCKECNYKTKRSDSLKRHLKLHNGAN